MFYKILYIIVAAAICLVTGYISTGIVTSNYMIECWRSCKENDDYSNILKWNDKYTKMDSYDTETCTIDIYKVYNEAIEKIDNKEVSVTATGYEFVIKNVNDKFIYSKNPTNSDDGKANFFIGNEKVEVGYKTFEIENIYFASFSIHLTDSSSALSVNEIFEQKNVTVGETYDTFEILDAEGNQVLILNDLKTSLELTDLDSWNVGYTSEEKESLYKDAKYYQVVIAVVVAVLIFVGLFFLIFFRKKKERLFLSDVKKPEQVKASSVKEPTTEIIDEDKIEDDDVDENSLL